MDIVKILRDAILALPRGEHSAGLNAILRHISAAIRHFERRDGLDQDNFTDAIYRTNQAYEGSLKEAYRVLAGKDPSGKTPHQIESYLETNNAVRPRVLVQLTRYRHDYRNPSTHDYKLDFDEDEALLSIVSVCAFAKLLVDQISERLAYSEQAKKVSAKKPVPRLSNSESFSKFVTSSILEYLNSDENSETSEEIEGFSPFKGGIAGYLSRTGLKTDLERKVYPDTDDDSTWDIFVKYGKFEIPIEVRGISGELEERNFYTLSFMAPPMEDQEIPEGLIIHRSYGDKKYNIYTTTFQNKKFYLISKFNTKDNNEVMNQGCEFY